MISKPKSTNILFLNSVFVFSILALVLIWLTTQLWTLKKIRIQSDSIKTTDFISGFGTFFTAAIAIITVLLAYRSLRHAQKAEEGDLYLKMMERYASSSMKNSLRVLCKWYEENKKDLPKGIETWMKERTDANKEAYQVEQARHELKYFFRDLMQLVQANYFSYDLAKRICNTGGRHLFKNVVLLMDKKMNRYYFEGEFEPFARIYSDLEKEQKK